MYLVILVVKMYGGREVAYRHLKFTYTSDTVPDIHALRQSSGVFDVAIYNTVTHHYTY